MIQIFGIDFWYGQTMPAKMPREFEERDVLFAHVVQNSDGGDLPARQPYNFAPRAAELPLQRLHLLHRYPEVLLEETVENVHDVYRATRGQQLTHNNSHTRFAHPRFPHKDIIEAQQKSCRGILKPNIANGWTETWKGERVG
jgi:hypothetical protein